MLWGSYGLVHIITLLLSAAIIVGLYFILRKCSEKVKTIVLFILVNLILGMTSQPIIALIEQGLKHFA